MGVACAWACVLAMLAVLPGMAHASPIIVDCDPASNPDVVEWVSEQPAAWSDAAAWSTGTVPDLDDTACVDGASGDVIITGGTMVAALFVGARHRVHVTDTGELMAEHIRVEGALSVDQGAVYATGISIAGTLDAGDGTVYSGLLELRGEETAAIVRGAVTGRDMILSGDIAGTGSIASEHSVQIDGDVRLAGITVSAHPGPSISLEALSGREDARVTLAGGARIDSPSLFVFVPLTLESCRLDAEQIVLQDIDIHVHDPGCIAPDKDLARTVHAAASDPPGPVPAIRFLTSGDLSSGGLLILDGIRMEIAAGVTLVADAAQIKSESAPVIGVHGVGTATFVYRSPASAWNSALPELMPDVKPGQVLVLDEFEYADADLWFNDGLVVPGGDRRTCLDPGLGGFDGVVRIRTANRRTWDCAWRAIIGPDGWRGPEYVDASGAVYEPARRGQLQLEGGTARLGATRQVQIVSGHGAVVGDLAAHIIDVDGVLSVEGALRMRQHVAVQQSVIELDVSADGSADTLDLRFAATQQLGSIVRVTGSGPAPTIRGRSWTVLPGIRHALPVEVHGWTLPAGLALRLEPGSGVLRVIETVAPGLPGAATVSVSGAHASAAWDAATDTGGSGVAGYAVSWTLQPDGSAGSVVTTTAPTAISAGLAPGTWWLHVAAIDGDGNVGATRSSGPITVSAPSPPTHDPGPRSPRAASLLALPTVTLATGVRLQWASDGQHEQRLEHATGNARGQLGRWRAEKLTPDAQTARVRLTPGRRTCVRIKTGTGAQIARSAMRCTSAALDDRKLTAVGFRSLKARWAHQRTIRTARRRGATLRIPVQRARSLTLVATTCPGCGSIRVMQGNRVLATRSLRAKRTTNAARVTIKLRRSTRSAPLRIETTSARPVTVDAVAAHW